MARTLTILRERDDDGPVLTRRPPPTDCALDMTPMIDVTFLLLIFFLVAAVPDRQASRNLPIAHHGAGVSRHDAVVIHVGEGGPGEEARIVLGLSPTGAALAGPPEAQEAQIRSTVAAARSSGKSEVIIKADRLVRHRVVARVMQAAGVEGMSIHLAVADPR